MIEALGGDENASPQHNLPPISSLDSTNSTPTQLGASPSTPILEVAPTTKPTYSRSLRGVSPAVRQLLDDVNEFDAFKRYFRLNQVSIWIEFTGRLILVNFPLFILSKSPELDRVCMVILSYLFFQVVGFSWAFLVNASFTLACESSMFVPGQIPTWMLICNFYVYYASIRTVISFAQTHAFVAFETLHDFGSLSKFVDRSGAKVLQLYHFVFIPVLLLEVLLLSADSLCTEDTEVGNATGNNNSSSSSSGSIGDSWTASFCYSTGLSNLTRSNVKYTLLLSLVVVVLQIWQVFLHQFPQWTNAFKAHNRPLRRIFQLTAFLLVASQFSIIPLKMLGVLGLKAQNASIAILLGWTLWLYSFVPTLIRQYSITWQGKSSCQYTQHLAVYIRLSLVIILFCLFMFILFWHGIHQAHLELTFVTIVVPVMYVFMYLLSIVALKSSKAFLYICVPIAFIVTIALVSRGLSSVGGQGTFMLLFSHIFSKFLHFFGAEDDGVEEVGIEILGGKENGSSGNSPGSSYGNFDLIRTCSIDFLNNETKEDTLANILSADGSSPSRRPSASDLLSILSTANGTGGQDGTSKLKKSCSDVSIASQINEQSNTTEEVSSKGLERGIRENLVTETLQERGGKDSSLVSINIDPSLRDHWATRLSQRTLSFMINLVRKLTVAESLTSGVMRLAIAVAVVCSIFLSILTLASIVQQNWKIYPKFMSFYDSPEAVLFDHTISNLTMFKKTSNSGSLFQQYDATNINKKFDYQTSSRIPPNYLACDLEWQGYSVLDMALLSQLAYLDNEDLNGVYKSLFPHHVVEDSFFESATHSINSHRRIEGGPMFIEVFDKKQNLVIIAVRGTDVTRLHDFLEDFKLYTEPVVFSMLSSVFVTMRMWSEDLTSVMIEKLYEFNAFFGLQGEAEYYQPLMKRVIEIASSGQQVIITGHSLGGGLARIVGSLTKQQSVSFSPPGIGMSYRKYSMAGVDGTAKKIENSGPLHHRSFSIVTEYDWVTDLDYQVGLVQNILCDKNEKSHLNSCHLLEGTICHLLKHCGDPRHERFHECEYTFDIKGLYPSMISFMLNHRFLFIPIFLLVVVFIGLAVIPEML